MLHVLQVGGQKMAFKLPAKNRQQLAKALARNPKVRLLWFPQKGPFSHSHPHLCLLWSWPLLVLYTLLVQAKIAATLQQQSGVTVARQMNRKQQQTRRTDARAQAANAKRGIVSQLPGRASGVQSC